MIRQTLLCIVFAAVLMPARLEAQGFLIPDNDSRLELREYRAAVTIQENLATFSTIHRFYNPTPIPVQGIFYFPLPADAQVSEFSMTADGKILPGELLEAEAARKIYRDIVRRALDPALLEMMDKNTFKASIFPIPPGKERQIEVKFASILPQENGLVKLVLPLRGDLKIEGHVPRPPLPRLPESPSYPLQKPLPTGEQSRAIDITINSASAVNNIYSPSHAVDIVRPDGRRARVSYEDRGQRQAGDFVLYYSLDVATLSMRALAYRAERTKPGYFALLISPPFAKDPHAVVSKDIIVVLDVSGSMQGKKLEQAKQALRYWIDNLDNDDRFGLITFSTAAESFRPALVPIRQVRQEVRDFVDKIDARGGTNINEALTAAYRMANPSANAMIVFVTDGLPTAGVTDEREILQNLHGLNKSGLRVFTFGVGYDVNTRLLDGVARATHAFSDYICPDENLEERISDFYEKIRYPILTDLRLEFGGADVDALQPATLPDLFIGQQVIVFGRYATSGNYQMRLSGRSGNQNKSFAQRIELPASASGNAFLAPLWASRKIGYLLDEIQLNGDNPELRNEVIALSKEFGIVTPYTAYLVQEDQPSTPPVFPTSSRSRFAPDARGKGVAGEALSAPRVMQESSGAGAVAMSVAKNEMKKAASLAEAGPGFAPGRQTRQVDGRTYVLSADGYWTDLAATKKAVTLHLRFASPAYFVLSQQYPEVNRILALGEKIVLVLHGKVIRIDDAGVERLSVAEMQNLLR